MGLPIYQVDAFTAAAFGGNPAAVVLLGEGAWPEAWWMQAVAAEMNLSETAFVQQRREPGVFGLRWFTPAAEVELCGHATLASAHVVWEGARVEGARDLAFETAFRGTLGCRRRTGAGWIEMDFPADPAAPCAVEAVPAGLIEALGLTSRPTAAGRSRYDWLIEVSGEEEVRGAEPGFEALRGYETRGIILTARAADSGAVDFVSRFFAPRLRVDEDPVTGSAHCVLGPWWAERLGRSELVGHQASRRGGRVGVAVRGERVGLSGEAVTVMRGELVGQGERRGA